MGKILATLKQGFDFIVVDTPPAFDDHVLQAFDESDLLLLLLTPDIPALKNLKITLEMLELLNYPRGKCRVVLNRAAAKVGLSSADIEKTLKCTLFATIPAAHEVPASINRGEPIVTSLPRHPVSQAVLAIARRLCRCDAVRGGCASNPAAGAVASRSAPSSPNVSQRATSADTASSERARPHEPPRASCVGRARSGGRPGAHREGDRCKTGIVTAGPAGSTHSPS